MPVDGRLRVPRGIDIPSGMGGMFNGMRTLQYFSIPDTGAGQENLGSGPNRRISIMFVP